MSIRYIEISDKIPRVRVRNKSRLRVACCDCGLVHNIVLTVPGKRKGFLIGYEAERNEAATRGRRKRLPEKSLQ